MQLKTKKIVIIIIIVVVVLLLVGVLAKSILSFTIYKSASDVIESSSDKMSKVEVELFNSKFEQYEGEKIRGATVNTLLNMIETTNSSNDVTRQVSVINNAKKWNTGSNKALTAVVYKVICEKSSETGLINVVRIEDIVNNESVKVFNSQFTKYEGEAIIGTKVNMLLELIIKNNSDNKDKQIKLLGNMKKWDFERNKADNASKYKVTCETDSNTGLVNVVKIQDANV